MKENNQQKEKQMEKRVGWCAKCKANKEMVNPIEEVNSRNMIMAKGQCITCKTNICTIIGKNPAPIVE